MSAPAGYKEREPGSLKEAAWLLVFACGGIDKCVDILGGRVGRSQLARYTDNSEEHQSVHMPLDVAIRLEAHCGDFIVTRYMAHEARALLVPLPDGKDESYLRQLCKIGETVGKFFEEAHAVLSDSAMSPKKAGRVKREAMKIATALGVLLGRLNRVIATGRDG